MINQVRFAVVFLTQMRTRANFLLRLARDAGAEKAFIFWKKRAWWAKMGRFLLVKGRIG